MIKLMKRILAASGKYKKRIQLAFVFSFLKSLLAKAPIMLAFLALAGFYEGTLAAVDCLWYGIAMIACVLLQVLFHHIADRLQSAAGFMVFSDMRMELGAHLRRMPMGYFTEGNIGKISSVLSSDMVFIEENCMTVLADMMSYIFAEAIMVIFLLFFNIWIGLAALAIIGIILLIARSMKKEALRDSKDRQEQNENLTEAVLDFVEGIGIIKTYNLLGEKSKELTENFEKSCETNIRFEENHSPYQLWMNIVYGLGVAAIVALSFFLHSQVLLGVTFLVGVILFVSDLFGPIKSLYTQATRLTVMNRCMDRIGLWREETAGQWEILHSGKQRRAGGGVSKRPLCLWGKGRAPQHFLHSPAAHHGGAGGPLRRREIHSGEPPGPILGRGFWEGAGAGQRCAGRASCRPDGSYLHGVSAGVSLPGYHLQQHRHGTARRHSGGSDGGGEKSPVLRLHHGAAERV